MARCIPYISGLSLLFWAAQWYHVLGCYILLMSGRYMVTTSTTALDAALIDVNERLTGIRRVGSVASQRTLLTASVTETQMVICMAVLSASGYDISAEVQTPQAQAAIRFATAGVPILFALAGLLPLLFLLYTRKRKMELTAWSQARRPQEGAALDAAGREPGSPSSPVSLPRPPQPPLPGPGPAAPADA